MHIHVERRYDHIFSKIVMITLMFIVCGLALDGPVAVGKGLIKICTHQDILITDYVALAGPGAAIVNAGLVTLIAIILLKVTGDPLNGFTFVEMGLMAGFSLFGKNIVNIWPILFGAWLYAKYQKEPFAKYVAVGMLATSLAPLVSYMAFGSQFASIPLGILIGIIIGFVLPPLSEYTYKIQNGMNLYNMGFACGLVALMAVPILTFLGDKPKSVLIWSVDHNTLFICLVSITAILLILTGLFLTHEEAKHVLESYKELLMSTGRAPSDYLRMFGIGAVMVNMGVNSLICMAYILLIGGELNGATVGGILTVIGFSAFGKHAFNIIPIMVGVAVGTIVCRHPLDYPSLQLAALFGTTLAPIAGHFGASAGVLAGFIHSALVLTTSDPVAGVNLYNNGFSGGLVAVVLYPTLTSIVRHRRPTLQDEDYYDLFEDDTIITKDHWRMRKNIRLRSRKRGHMSDVVPEEEAEVVEAFVASHHMPEDDAHHSKEFESSYPQMPEDDAPPSKEFESNYPQMPEDHH